MLLLNIFVMKENKINVSMGHGCPRVQTGNWGHTDKNLLRRTIHHIKAPSKFRVICFLEKLDKSLYGQTHRHRDRLKDMTKT